MRDTLLRVVLLSFIGIALLGSPMTAMAQTPEEDLGALAVQAQAALDKLAANDVAGARSALAAFIDGWGPIEDGIREKSAPHYVAIEAAMGDASFALNSEPPKTQAARDALTRLSALSASFVKGEPLPVSQQPAKKEEVSLPSVVVHLDKAIALLGAANVQGATQEIIIFRQEWPIVEGLVRVKSPAVYQSTENNMAKAYGLLTQTPPDAAGARETILKMKADLAPFSEGDTQHYGVFDAAIILIREGMEALLVIGALLAFLKKSGNGDKQRWIWAGSATGIAASFLVALIINVAFAKTTAGANREILEGITGLVAAVMLLYVSFWLHSKANLGAWHQYINNGVSGAIARNSLYSLALLAFLAVFREGAETVLFYIGIAPDISTVNLLTGVGIATVFLALVGGLIFFLGVRIPVGPFFRIASLLIYYLAFKFVGTGIHAFQVAGKLPTTTAEFLPSNGFLGLYPNWQSTLAQMALLAVALAVVLYGRLHKKKTSQSMTEEANKASVAKNTGDS